VKVQEDFGSVLALTLLCIQCSFILGRELFKEQLMVVSGVSGYRQEIHLPCESSAHSGNRFSTLLSSGSAGVKALNQTLSRGENAQHARLCASPFYVDT
jgi:hypothetical protein